MPSHCLNQRWLSSMMHAYTTPPDLGMLIMVISSIFCMIPIFTQDYLFVISLWFPLMSCVSCVAFSKEASLLLTVFQLYKNFLSNSCHRRSSRGSPHMKAQPCSGQWRLHSEQTMSPWSQASEHPGSMASNRQHILTHWGRDKIDAISQTTFSSAFSWKIILNSD